jgi:hypothetical protein
MGADTVQPAHREGAMTEGRLSDALARMARMQASLGELEEMLSARLEPDRNPLQAYIEGDVAPPPREPFVARPPGATDGIQHSHRRHPRPFAPKRVARRLGSTARVAALPMVLALALSLFGLVRLQPANTLWYQELTLTSSVGTGDFGCEPLKLEFVGLTHPETGKTTLTYTLSGGGTQGFGCPAKDISNIAIPVGTCFNPEVKSEGPVIAETHPGSGTTAWKYSPKNSSTPKLVKWDSQSDDAPLGGKGPFDPDDMKFSITFDRVLTSGDLEDAMAYYKAGQDTPDLGEVSVPKCPLPAAPAPLAKSQAAPETDSVVEPEDEPEPEVIEEVVPEPEEEETPGDTKPSKPGPAMTDGQQKPPRVKPTPTPTPIGVAIYGGGR